MKTIILLTILLSLNAQAGNEKGNGGDAIVCRNTKGEIVKSELLDYYEGRNYRQMDHLFEASYTQEEYFEELSSKLQGIDKELYKTFKTDSLDLLKSIHEYRARLPQSMPGYVYTNGTLVDIPDSAHLVMPKACAVEQFVIQVAQVFPEDPKFIIQSDIVDSMSDDDIRGIVLHESLYKSYIKAFKIDNSVATRFIHQSITSLPLVDFNFIVYIELFKDLFIAPKFAPEEIFRVKNRKMFFDDYLLVGDSAIEIDMIGGRFVLDRNGIVDRQKTIQRTHSYNTLSYKLTNIKQNCSINKPRIKMTYANGTSEELDLTIFESKMVKMKYGKVKVKLELTASKNSACNNGIININYFGGTMLSAKILPTAQTLEIELWHDLDKDYNEFFTK